MDFIALMQGLADAASAGDGDKVANYFTEDGIYHDVYYGTFQGHENIKKMIETLFHGHATDFIWDFHDPITNGKTGYARYVFSYKSTLEGFEGNQAMFEGVSYVELEGDKLKSYQEIANIGPGLVSLGFPAERTYKILQKHATQLQERGESQHHFQAS